MSVYFINGIVTTPSISECIFISLSRLSQVRPVNYHDFEDAFCNIRASVSDKDLEVYIDWNKKYGCGNPSNKRQT